MRNRNSPSTEQKIYTTERHILWMLNIFEHDVDLSTFSDKKVIGSMTGSVIGAKAERFYNLLNK